MTSRTMRPDRRLRAPERDTILRVAADLIRRRGYRSTTMQDLAEELGIAKATLYAHARSKPDVLVGIIDQWTQHIDEDLAAALEHDDPTERVRVLLRLWTERSVAMKAHRSVFALCATEHELPADLSGRYRDWEDGVRQRLRDLVALAQSMGVVRAEIDPTVAALNLIHAPTWAADHLVETGVMDIDAAVEQVLDVLLHGLFGPAASGQP